jgi:hypothetical protein
MDSLVYIIPAIIIIWVAFGRKNKPCSDSPKQRGLLSLSAETPRARPTTTAFKNNNSESLTRLERIWTPDKLDPKIAIHVVLKQVWPIGDLTSEAAELLSQVLEGVIQLVLETASKSNNGKGGGLLSFGAIRTAVANVFNEQGQALGGNAIHEMEKARKRLQLLHRQDSETTGQESGGDQLFPWKEYRIVADDNAALGLAALKEYLCAEILELSGRKADLQYDKEKNNPITPIEIKHAINEDRGLKSVLGNLLDQQPVLRNKIKRGAGAASPSKQRK